MIEARGLVKRYGPTTAVDHLTFDVRPGSVTGFLGPNGAGKSTTMRMMLGLDRPDAGTVRINGKDYRDLRSPLREVGALLEAKAFHPGRTARSHLAAQGRTVLISSHLISEVAQTAGQLIVIGQGRLLAQTTVAELSARSHSLEEAFFQLTEGSAEYSASSIAYQGSAS